MKLEAITSFFSNKSKKAAYDTAEKIEELSCKLSGIKIQDKGKPRELKEILEVSCNLLEKLDLKLEEENKRKANKYSKNSGFATAKVTLSENNDIKSNIDTE